MKFLLKKKIFYIVIGLVVIAVLFFSLNKGKKVEYVLADAAKGQIIQTVNVTGSIKADPTIDLHFKKSGEVKEILVKEGQLVKKDDVLATLENKTLELEIQRNQASMDYATAQYNQLKAGAKNEEIQIAAADVESAQAAYQASLTDINTVKSNGDASIQLAEIAYKQAQDNVDATKQDYATTKSLAEKEIAKLKLDSKTNTNTIALKNAYVNARTKVAAMLPILQDAMYLAEKVGNYKGLGTSDVPYNERGRFATPHYGTAVTSLSNAEKLFGLLTSTSTNEEIDACVEKTIDAANSVISLMVFQASTLQSIAFYGTAIGDLIVDVTAMSTKITTALASLTDIQKTIQDLTTGLGQDTETTILTYQLKIDAAENAYTTALNTLNKAKFDLDQAKINADNNNKNSQAAADIKKAALSAAQASLNLRKSPVREIDLAPFAAQMALSRVALEIAQNEYKDSQLIAPIDGLVTFINGDVGENVSLSETALKSFVSMQADNLIVEANVPETDITKIKVGDKVQMTIDAFDFTKKFDGTVIYVDPAETVIQGVVYYRIQTAFDLKDENLKSGMTTNLSIVTAEKSEVLTIPIRAVKYEDSTRYVEVLGKNGQSEKRVIKTGLENDQYVEILEGLNEGDKIITFVK